MEKDLKTQQKKAEEERCFRSRGAGSRIAELQRHEESRNTAPEEADSQKERQ